MDSNIKNELLRYVYDNSFAFDGELDDIPFDEPLIEMGLLDSSGIIELLFFIERKWNIEISAEDLTVGEIGSVNQIAVFIEQKLSKN
jgi:acyl carrier protein